MSSTPRAFVIMPFGKKKAADGTAIDFDVIYKNYLAPAIEAAGMAPHRADADRHGGSIHADMFQDLLLAEFVVADLTIDNPNVWYEIGVRHALRMNGVVMTYALRDRLPFDIAGQRMMRYTLEGGELDQEKLKEEAPALSAAIVETRGDWIRRRASPVYQQLPNLKQPDWKTLKVGDVNQYWEQLDKWSARIEVARRNGKPGDILVLADETPNRLLEFEALQKAADALLQLNHPNFALKAIEKARALDPDNVKARHTEAIALGRTQKFEAARESLENLARDCKDGETLSLLARCWKDEWTRLWRTHRQYENDPVAAARDTAAALRKASEFYSDAFVKNPASYYPGINALTLGRLWEHVTGRDIAELALIAAGVRWALECALASKKDYWALATRAEFFLVENEAENAADAFEVAAAIAVDERHRFALDSTGQQLEIMARLKFRPDIADRAMLTLKRADEQLDALCGARAVEPAHVVLFSGHMIDDPAKRGPGKEKPPRFPAAKADAAGNRIREALDEIGAGAGDLGLCGGAAGGDLLFAEACLERGMHLEVRLARQENDFLAESVTFADPARRWQKSFDAVTRNANTKLFIMPDELGKAPDGVSVHDRCNRWMLYCALSYGLGRNAFVTLWNGEAGDGPGGTEHMAAIVKKLTGRQPIVIDPTTL